MLLTPKRRSRLCRSAITPICQLAALLLLGTASARAQTSLSPSNPTITTTQPTVSVTVPNTSGPVTFQVVVTDSTGAVSQPATVTINIHQPPVAQLTATPTSVAPGRAITLSAAGSTGQIVSYRFSLLP